MTAGELASRIGQSAFYFGITGLRVTVVIKDVRSAYGNVHYLVAPAQGEGEIWTAQVVFQD